MDIRKEFEEWAKGEGYYFDRDKEAPDEYENDATQVAWEVWQASHEHYLLETLRRMGSPDGGVRLWLHRNGHFSRSTVPGWNEPEYIAHPVSVETFDEVIQAREEARIESVARSIDILVHGRTRMSKDECRAAAKGILLDMALAAERAEKKGDRAR
jgi:hypothetical protein